MIQRKCKISFSSKYIFINGNPVMPAAKSKVTRGSPQPGFRERTWTSRL